MGDPFAIFAAEPGKQESLRIIWPELHACLGRTDGPPKERLVRCALGLSHGRGAWRQAVGRARFPDAHPACEGCLTVLGGERFPLIREAEK